MPRIPPCATFSLTAARWCCATPTASLCRSRLPPTVARRSASLILHSSRAACRGLGYASYTLEPATPAEVAATEAKWASGQPRTIQRVWFQAESPELVLENWRGASGHRAQQRLGETRFVAWQGQRGGEQLGPHGTSGTPGGLSPPAAGAVGGRSCTRKKRAVRGPPAPRRCACWPTVRCSRRWQCGAVCWARRRSCAIRFIATCRGWMSKCGLIGTCGGFGRIELSYQVPLKNARAAHGLPFGAGGVRRGAVDAWQRPHWRRRRLARLLGTHARNLSLARCWRQSARHRDGDFAPLDAR